MKGKSLFSVLAVIVLIAAVIMFISRFDIDDMGGDEWTFVLIVTGVLFGVIALIVKRSSKIEDDEDDEDDEDLEESELI